MARGREQSEWDRTASMMTLTHNLAVRKNAQRKVHEFHPLMDRKAAASRAPITALKALLPSGEGDAQDGGG